MIKSLILRMAAFMAHTFDLSYLSMSVCVLGKKPAVSCKTMFETVQQPHAELRQCLAIIINKDA